MNIAILAETIMWHKYLDANDTGKPAALNARDSNFGNGNIQTRLESSITIRRSPRQNDFT